MDDLKRLDKLEKDIMFIANIRDVLQEVSCFEDIPERDVVLENTPSLRCICETSHQPAHDFQNYALDLENERKLRKEVEESAKLVNIKLQKTEDELERYREMKRTLLMGTLELKNQMQSYESQISSSQSEIDRLKAQQQNWQKSEEQIILENRRLTKDKEAQLEEIKFLQKKLSHFEQSKAKRELSLNRESVQKDEHIKETEARLEEALRSNELLLKYQRIHEDKLKDLQMKIEEERSAKEKETDSRNLQETQRLEMESQKSSRVLMRVKAILLKINHDRAAAKKAIQTYRRKLQEGRESWRRKQRELLGRLKCLESQLTQMNANVECTTKATDDERQRLGTIVKRLECEKATLEKRISYKDDFISKQLKDKDEELERERKEVARLKAELERVNDNISVLQKVSEDQVKTIKKHRSELEELKEEQVCRERKAACTERELKLLVEEEATERRRFRSIAAKLEEQLHSLQADVERHNCEDEVDVTWRSRVEKLEKQIGSLEKERNSAVDAARKAVEGAKEVKQRCERKSETMKISFVDRIARLEKDKAATEVEMNKKVKELEVEVVRSKKLAEQMQETYGAKVAHLQGILQACLTGGQTFLGPGGHATFDQQSVNSSNSFNSIGGMFPKVPTIPSDMNSTFNTRMAFP